MKLITLTGASASGKDFLLKEILLENEDVKPIISVTTRPKREGEEDGREYNFISFDEFFNISSNDGLIEMREYKTVEGSWYYGVTKDSVDVDSDDVYIVILDVGGVVQLKNYLSSIKSVKPIEFHSVFINCNGYERMLRSLYRESKLDDNQVAELCRRYLADQNQVVAYKDMFNLVLKNETFEDTERCKKIIGSLIRTEEGMK